jgi:hypothetical protein
MQLLVEFFFSFPFPPPCQKECMSCMAEMSPEAGRGRKRMMSICVDRGTETDRGDLGRCGLCA